jgi:hypothetical protein
MALLLILASPHVLLELSGAGARPVHSIRVISLLRGKSASFGATGHRDRLVHAPNLHASV